MHTHPTATPASAPDAAAETADTAVGEVTFSLLGPLEIRKDGRDYAPTAPKVLQLLAMLLLQPGKAVHIDSIIKELWGGNPPPSVRTTMQTYVYQLRKCIEQNKLAPNPESLLITKPPGYQFQIRQEQVDVFVFQRLSVRGKDAMRGRNYREAARTLRAALALWGGEPLANVQCGAVLSAYAVDLQEQWRTTLHLRLEAELESGMHRDVLGELRHLVTDNPFDEGLHGLLMKALGASGRRSDALATYRRLRAVLNEELGVEPCTELQQMHTELLSAS